MEVYKGQTLTWAGFLSRAQAALDQRLIALPATANRELLLAEDCVAAAPADLARDFLPSTMDNLMAAATSTGTRGASPPYTLGSTYSERSTCLGINPAVFTYHLTSI